jgi:hypothetical protein
MTLDVIAAARRRTRRRLTVAVLIAVGVLAALVYPAGLYVNSHLDDQALPSTSSPNRSTPSSPEPTGGPVLPAGVSFVRVAGVDLPVSAATGPTETVGGLARGFAHTRNGAVVAALHLIVRTTPQVGPVVFEPTLLDQVVGNQADAMRAHVRALYAQAAADTGVVYGQPLRDLSATVAGVRIDAYTDELATLSVLTRAVDATGATRYAATTVRVSYTDGDWRLVAPRDGRWDSDVVLLRPDQVSGYPPLAGR